MSLDDPVLDHLPDLEPSAAVGTQTITIDQLLTMTSGIVYRWEDVDRSAPIQQELRAVGDVCGRVPTVGAFRTRWGVTRVRVPTVGAFRTRWDVTRVRVPTVGGFRTR